MPPKTIVLHDMHPRHTGTHDILLPSPRHLPEKACVPRHISTTCMCSTTYFHCLHDMSQKGLLPTTYIHDMLVAHDMHQRQACVPRHASTTNVCSTTCIHDTAHTHDIPPLSLHITRRMTVIHDMAPRHIRNPRHARVNPRCGSTTSLFSTTWVHVAHDIICIHDMVTQFHDMLK